MPMTLSEATLTAAFDGAPFGIAVYDLSGDYVCVRHNQPFLDLVGADHRERGTIVGVPLRDLFDDASYASVRTVFDQVRTSRERVLVDDFPAVLPPDPEPRYYRWSLTPALEGGRVVFLICTAVEVTDLVRARRRAEQESKQLRFLADAGTALASSLDLDATLGQAARLAVPWFADFCTIDVVSTEGHLRRVAVAHDDPKIQAEMQALAAGYAPGWEAHHPVGAVLASGEPIVVNELPSPVMEAIGSGDPSFALSRASGPRSYMLCPLLARGHKIGVIGFVITGAGPARSYSEGDLPLGQEFARRAALAIDNARLLAEAEAARVSAETANRSKDEFLAMLGHELRNPLAPIRTAVQLMKLRGASGAKERDVIERQVAHLSRLVDDLLDVARIARGKIELTRHPVELSLLVAKAVEQAAPLFEQRDHHLTVDVPAEGLLVSADAFRLSQVIANLLTNAAKYTSPRGHVSVRGTREPGHVVLRVKDDGIGIGPELLPVVFDLFVQGRRTLDQTSGGLGLGLALVSNLVTLHGGTVAAHSDGPDRGSEFVVRLPALDAEAVASAAVAAPARAPERARRRILLVDDNEDALDFLAAALRYSGHDVVVAGDGSEALRVLETFEPDVGVLDLGMPVMDGFELAREILRRPTARKPRLIAVSGFGQPRDRLQSREAGFDVHLVKPVDLETLLRAIDAG
jgi:signal transduction histidine kinase/CheY-like chemotaxis protein